MKEYNTFFLIISSITTLIFRCAFEMEGGGISLITIITIPFFLILGLLLATLWHYVVFRKAGKTFRVLYLIFSYMILNFGAFLLFPFKNPLIPIY